LSARGDAAFRQGRKGTHQTKSKEPPEVISFTLQHGFLSRVTLSSLLQKQPSPFPADTMHRSLRSLLILIPFLLAPMRVVAQESNAPVESIMNWHPINEQLFTAGQPGMQHMSALKALGIDTIISLATPSSANMQEANRAAELGMSFVSIPFGDDGPTPDDVEWFSSVVQAQDGKKVLVHCNTNRRASAFTFLHRVIALGVDPEEAMKDLQFDPELSSTWSNLFDQMLADTTDAAVIIQPGAPGSEGTRIDDPDALSLGMGTFTEADIAFMQGMIHHHAQALEMVQLMEGRTNARDLIMLGKRIDISQKSEIKLMANWLKEAGAEVPMMADPAYVSGAHMRHGSHASGHSGHAMHGSGAGMHDAGESDHAMMPGMLSHDQMQQLTEASGDTFYRLWLTFMIQHHEGALTMVDTLFSQAGAGQNQDVFHFASEVDIDQGIEIMRMRQMLKNVSSD
jgi:uncharacterized protein (DUF305 family)/protein tyrosine phosphatase (PTP) superfamily phosphohydrolase (DUF442 family)